MLVQPQGAQTHNRLLEVKLQIYYKIDKTVKMPMNI